MEFSNEYYARLIVMEGFRAKAYRCPSGVWTIGYGTTTGVKEGMVVNQNQAFKLLQDDSSKLERLINKLGVDFTQNQFDAIGLFCYNCGFPAFKRTTDMTRELKSCGCNGSTAKAKSSWDWNVGATLKLIFILVFSVMLVGCKTAQPISIKTLHVSIYVRDSVIINN